MISFAATWLLAAMSIIAAVNLLTAPRLHRRSARSASLSGRAVSLLIPARNEEASLGALLASLRTVDDPSLEILVLDDESVDATAAIGAEASAADPRIRTLTGRALPGGWLGKNWACHQLAGEAKGDVLIFCDADVRLGPLAVANTLAALEGADLVTALPRQQLGGIVERALVPMVTQLPVTGLLPLRLVIGSRSERLRFGNGQWMAFRRPIYERIGGHEAVRDQVVEDMELARLVRRSGGRLLPVLATRDLTVRMYHTPRGVIRGFLKNLYPLVGAHPGGLAAGVVLTYLTMIHPWLSLVIGAPAMAPLALLILFRVLAAATFRHSAAVVLLHPLGAILLPLVAIASAIEGRRGRLSWRERPLPLRS